MVEHPLINKYIVELYNFPSFRSVKKMKIATSFECIPFQRILAKSPDVSPTDYCAFGLLKRALSRSKSTTI